MQYSFNSSSSWDRDLEVKDVSDIPTNWELFSILSDSESSQLLLYYETNTNSYKTVTLWK